MRFPGAGSDAADREIVHGAGSRGGNTIRNCLGQSAQQHVDDALRGFNISAGHCCRRPGVDDGALGSNDPDRTHETCGRGNIFGEQTAEDIKACRIGDGCDRIDAALNLWMASGEIHGDHAAAIVSTVFAGWTVTFTSILIGASLMPSLSRKSSAEYSPGGTCCRNARISSSEYRCNWSAALGAPRETVPHAYFAKAFRAGMAGCDLRAEIPFALVRRAYVGQEQGKHLIIFGALAQ